MAVKHKPRRRWRDVARDHDMPVAYLIRLAIIAFMTWQGVKSGDTDLAKWNASYLTGISQQVAEIQKALKH